MSFNIIKKQNCFQKGIVMDNNPNNYNVNGEPYVNAPVAEQPVIQPQVQPVEQPVAQPQVQPQQTVVQPQQTVAYTTVYNQGYTPVGYNVQPQQPVVVYTTQPQYYTAPVQPNPYYVQPQVQQSPSTIYYNTQVAGVPQYHYGNSTMGGFMNNAYFEEQQRKVAERRATEKKYRDIGNVSGIASLVCFGFAFIFSMLFLIDKVSEIYDGSLVGMSLINMLYTLFVVGGSFFAFKKSLDNMGNGRMLKLDNKQRQSYALDFSGPKDFKKTFLIILIGLGGCMLANYISSAILTVLEGFGIYSTYSTLEDPQNLYDVVALFLATAIMPALIEEISMRGILMTPMRKYGNAFAILASSYIFGVFHGDAAQIPFAFICGLFFGYAVVVTGSIWPAVIIHGLNNALSCVSAVIVTYVSEDAGNTFYYICTLGLIVLGVIAGYFYLKKYKEQDFALVKGDAQNESITFGKKFQKFITSPAMIIMTVLYVIEALGTLTTTPPIE